MRLDLSPLLDHPLGDRLHDKVMAHIALRIIRATNKDSAAENLTEATFCRQLKVSRTVVREAVRVLAGKGLVEVRQKAGIRGRPRRYWHLSDPDVLRWIRKGRAEPPAHSRSLRDPTDSRAGGGRAGS